jgi:hypothetical protein
MRRELARHSVSKRFSGSLPARKASVLRQVDLNVPKTSTISELAERRETASVSLQPTYLLLIGTDLVSHTRRLPWLIAAIRRLLLKSAQERSVNEDIPHHPLDPPLDLWSSSYQLHCGSLAIKNRFRQEEMAATMETAHPLIMLLFKTLPLTAMMFQMAWDLVSWNISS